MTKEEIESMRASEHLQEASKGSNSSDRQSWLRGADGEGAAIATSVSGGRHAMMGNVFF